MKPDIAKPTYDPWNPATWPKEHCFWWAFFIANMVFVWLTPLDVLDRYPQLVPFTDFMASWNTQIRRLGEYSGAVNQANRFCSSVLWCLMPLVMWRVIGLDFGIRKIPTATIKAPFFGLVCGVILLWLIWASPSQPIESNRIGRLMFGSSVGRGLFLPGSIYVFGILIVGYWLYVLAALKGKFVITGSK